MPLAATYTHSRTHVCAHTRGTYSYTVRTCTYATAYTPYINCAAAHRLHHLRQRNCRDVMELRAARERRATQLATRNFPLLAAWNSRTAIVVRRYTISPCVASSPPSASQLMSWNISRFIHRDIVIPRNLADSIVRRIVHELYATKIISSREAGPANSNCKSSAKILFSRHRKFNRNDRADFISRKGRHCRLAESRAIRKTF